MSSEGRFLPAVKKTSAHGTARRILMGMDYNASICLLLAMSIFQLLVMLLHGWNNLNLV